MQPENLRELADFWPTRILLTAVELDLFSALDDPATAAEVAQALELDHEATYRLLNALVAMEILDLGDGRYTIKPELSEALGGGPMTLIPALKHRAHLWRIWSALTEVVRTGKHFDALHEREGEPAERLRDFIMAMAVSARSTARVVLDALDLEGVESVLDVGGGPGAYAAMFKDALPNAEVAVLDRPGVPEIAEEYLEGTPHRGRIRFIEDDAIVVNPEKVIGPDGSGRFDLVFMSSLIHSMSPDEIKLLFSNCVEWCTPGGRIVVKDFLMDDTRTRPPRGALFAINMLVATPGGNSYTWTEVEEWLGAVRCRDGKPAVASVSRIQLPGGLDGMLIAATALP